MRKPKMAIRVCYNFLFLFQQIWMKIYINRCESPPAWEYDDGLEKVDWLCQSIFVFFLKLNDFELIEF